MSMSLIPYSKPFLTVTEQVDLLRRRGMAFDDDAEVAAWLQRAGYYRLSGYWYPFRRSEIVGTIQLPNGQTRNDVRVRDDLVAGTSWDQVVELYEFDRKLRQLVFDAIERVEVGLRFHVGHTLGARGGAQAYLDPAYLDTSSITVRHGRRRRSQHDRLLEKIRTAIDLSDAQFVDHYTSTYSSSMPIWMLTELLSFGDLLFLFRSLATRDRDAIALGVGIRDASGAGAGGALQVWWKNLRYIRNTCAHHSRLWNLNVTQRIADQHLRPFDALRHTAGAARPRLYPTLAVLSYLTHRINPADDWCWKLREFLEDCPRAGRSLDEMGFPPGWEEEPVWNLV